MHEASSLLRTELPVWTFITSGTPYPKFSKSLRTSHYYAYVLVRILKIFLTFCPQIEPLAAEQYDTRGRNFLHTAILKDDLESVLFLLSIHVNVHSR